MPYKNKISSTNILYLNNGLLSIYWPT